MPRKKYSRSMFSSDPRAPEEAVEDNAAETETLSVYSPPEEMQPVIPSFADWVKREHKPKDQNSLKEYEKLFGVSE